MHDLGRYPELLLSQTTGAMDFEKAQQIQLHAALSSHIGATLARQYRDSGETNPEIIKASLAFNRRVIGAVAFHGGKNEMRDPIAHHIQSCDRLAGILGIREFVRNIICDGVLRGADVYPDEQLDFSHSFPLFRNLPADNFRGRSKPSDSWTNVFHYLEMPLRNMYPLSTELGMERAAEMRRQSGMILTFLSGGEKTDLYRHTFAPELQGESQEKSSGRFTFPKSPLPGNIWTAIKTGLTENEQTQMELYENWPLGDLTNRMLDQQAFHITDEDRTKVHALLNGIDLSHSRHLHCAVRYVVAVRNLKIVEERQVIAGCQNSEDPLIVKVAKRLLKNKLFAQ